MIGLGNSELCSMSKVSSSTNEQESLFPPWVSCNSLLISPHWSGERCSLLQKLVNFLGDGLRSADSLQLMWLVISLSPRECKVLGHCLEVFVLYLRDSSPASETNNTFVKLKKPLAACCLCNKFPSSTNSLIWAFSRTQLICKNRWLTHQCSIKIHTWLPRQHCLKNKWGDKWAYSQSS